MTLTTAPPGIVGLDVPVVQWPAEEDVRRELAQLGRPRILVVEQGVWPPDLIDDHEDWVRAPADPIDLWARHEALQRRVERGAPVEFEIDADGLLRSGATWVALTDAQVPVVRLLLDNVEKVVRFDAVAQAYETGGGSGHPASIRTLLTRLHTRISAVSLELITVRRRGVILRRSAPRQGWE